MFIEVFSGLLPFETYFTVVHSLQVHELIMIEQVFNVLKLSRTDYAHIQYRRVNESGVKKILSIVLKNLPAGFAIIGEWIEASEQVFKISNSVGNITQAASITVKRIICG